VGWEWRASATCLQNGLGNARCWALFPGRYDSRTGLCLSRSPFPGNGNSRPENRARQTPLQIQIPGARDQAFAAHAAFWGLFARNREISPNVGLRGGLGRTRTSSQTIMSGHCGPAVIWCHHLLRKQCRQHRPSKAWPYSFGAVGYRTVANLRRHCRQNVC
jgi:hypothetical protein